jgi:hypothetical protein
MQTPCALTLDLTGGQGIEAPLAARTPLGVRVEGPVMGPGYHFLNGDGRPLSMNC